MVEPYEKTEFFTPDSDLVTNGRWQMANGNGACSVAAD